VHVAPQATSPPPHEQTPPKHDAPGAQAFAQAPQFAGSEETSTHVRPPQRSHPGPPSVPPPSSLPVPASGGRSWSVAIHPCSHRLSEGSRSGLPSGMCRPHGAGDPATFWNSSESSGI
jgi:hypothetical protein